MSSAFDPQPVLLEGRHVRLEPLALRHAESLFEASRAAGIWTYLLIPQFVSVDAVHDWITDSLRAQSAGSDVAFATVRQSDGRVMGSTRFLEIRRPHRCLEIGWTWLSPEGQRTAINTEAKYLMLRHAFETLRCIAVDLRTHEKNFQSRAAIERLGAKLDGILRNHRIMPDGSLRNTASYSIIDAEWPAVKARLEARLSGARAEEAKCE